MLDNIEQLRVRGELSLIFKMIEAQNDVVGEVALWDEDTCNKFLEKNGGFVSFQCEGEETTFLSLDNKRRQCGIILSQQRTKELL